MLEDRKKISFVSYCLYIYLQHFGLHDFFFFFKHNKIYHKSSKYPDIQHLLQTKDCTPSVANLKSTELGN